METSLVTLGCCMLANDRQTASYVKNLGCNSLITKYSCCGCDLIPDTFNCLGSFGASGPFNTPATDYATAVGSGGTSPAWWYDPLVPESGDVAGLWITALDGFGSTTTQATDQALTGGLAFGIRRSAGRCITATGWIDSKSCAGARYMVQALQRRLQVGCEDSLWVQTACPTSTDDDNHTIEIPQVRLTSPVTVIDRRGKCCPKSCSGSAIKVQWTWCAPYEDMYLANEVTCSGSVNPDPDTCTCDVMQWMSSLGATPTCYGCPPVVIPTPNTNPCCGNDIVTNSLPTTSVRGCFVHPLTFGVVGCSVAVAQQFYKHSVSIAVTAGSTPMNNVRVVAFAKQFTGETMPVTAADWIAKYRCQVPLLDIRISAMVARSTVSIDAIERNITVSYPGVDGSFPAWSQVEVGAGAGSNSVLQALELDSCGELFVYIVTDCANPSVGGTYNISVRPSISSSF